MGSGLRNGKRKSGREASWNCDSDEGVTEVIAQVSHAGKPHPSGARDASSMRLPDWLVDRRCGRAAQRCGTFSQNQRCRKRYMRCGKVCARRICDADFCERKPRRLLLLLEPPAVNALFAARSLPHPGPSTQNNPSRVRGPSDCGKESRRGRCVPVGIICTRMEAHLSSFSMRWINALDTKRYGGTWRT